MTCVYRLLMIVYLAFGALEPLFSQSQKAKLLPMTQDDDRLLGLAQEQFVKARYDKAAKLYRKFLIRHPEQTDIWARLAASYYHSGVPDKALVILKTIEKKSTNPSYNYFYQALCYEALEIPAKARSYFRKATAYPTEFGGHAIYELAIIAYNEKQSYRAHFWLTQYRERFPVGLHTKTVNDMLDSLRKGVFIEGLKGYSKPELDPLRYKYSALSLMDYPHYWFFQGGVTSESSTGQEPDAEGKLSAKVDENQSLSLRGGIGFGPFTGLRFRNDDKPQGPVQKLFWGGYNYEQNWESNSDRIDMFLEDPADLSYQPFRADLMERTHQFYLTYQVNFFKYYQVGLYLRQQFGREGTRLLTGPDVGELEKVLKTRDATLAIPWTGFAWSDHAQSIFYLYLNKEIESDDPEYSNKSYVFEGDAPNLSFGFNHYHVIPEWNLELGLELFQYELVYNDYWLDFNRQGGLISLEYRLLPRFYINVAMGQFSDTYILSRLKIGGCTLVNKGSESGGVELSDTDPSECPRSDTGTLQKMGLFYDYALYQRAELQYITMNHKNPDSREFEQSKIIILAQISIAFPDVKKSLRLSDRFSETQFAKTKN